MIFFVTITLLSNRIQNRIKSCFLRNTVHAVLRLIASLQRFKHESSEGQKLCSYKKKSTSYSKPQNTRFNNEPLHFLHASLVKSIRSGM